MFPAIFRADNTLASSFRYRRQDAIGTPFCITIDHQTLEDNAVTIRYRDTMEQERVAIDQLHDILRKKTDLREILKEVKI